MTDLPLVTIIVPVFNGERHLRESLDSILAQTYPRIEVLVLDDASTDRTPEIIASYGDRVRGHRQARNRGIYGNANDGIALARGEYIAIYHADDIYLPTIVAREAEFLGRHPGVGAVFCEDIFIDAAGREYGRLALPPEVRGGRPLDYPVILNALLRHKNRFLRCPSSMVRAAVYREVGPYRDREFQIASDLEMWMRIARRYPIAILEEHLFRYRHFHNNATQQYYHLRTEEELHYRVMDECLAAGERALASPASLAAHEAHRAEDRLMLAINHYILGQVERARMVLRETSWRRLIGSPRVERGRLAALWLAMQALVRAPRSQWLADVFYRRWHEPRGARGARGA